MFGDTVTLLYRVSLIERGECSTKYDTSDETAATETITMTTITLEIIITNTNTIISITTTLAPTVHVYVLGRRYDDAITSSFCRLHTQLVAASAARS